MQNGTEQQNTLLIESFRIQRIMPQILNLLLLHCSEMKINDLFVSRHYCNSNLLRSERVITFGRKLFREDVRIRMNTDIFSNEQGQLRLGTANTLPSLLFVLFCLLFVLFCCYL
jgi:hypothetical protein